jgi:ArsR family transcriptional regulator
MDLDCFSKRKGENKNLSEVYNFLKIISDKNRLKIFCLLKKKPLCVCKIFQALNISQKLTSHHLGQLRRAGILDMRKEGSFVYYSLNKKVLKEKNKLLNKLINK